MANKLFKKTSSGTSSIKFYKKTSTGQTQCPVYKKTSSGMERLDQQLVTKTYTVEGYCDWCCCYMGSSSSQSSLSKKGTDPIYPRHGRYSNYYYWSPISFETVFKKVRGKNITKVELKLHSLHSYYSTGMDVYVSGFGSLATTSTPSSVNSNIFNNARYSSDTHYAKSGESKYITLNSTGINAVKNSQINGFRMIASGGWSLDDYGYFEGSGTNRPYIRITYTEQVWE